MADVQRRDRGDRGLEKGKMREIREHESPEEDEKEHKKGVDRWESQDREEGEVEKGETKERRKHDSSEEGEREHKKEVDRSQRRDREDGELEKRKRRDRRKHESSEEDEKEHKEVDRRGRRDMEDEELDNGRKRDRRKHESSDEDEKEHKEVERWKSRHRENEVTEKGKRRRERRRKYESSEEEKEHNEEVERGERRRSRRDGESTRDTRSPEHRRSRRDDDYRHSRREKFQHRSPVDHRRRPNDWSPEEDQRRSSRRERGRVEEDEDRRSRKDVDRDNKKEEFPGGIKDFDRLRKNAEIPGLTAGNQNPAGDVATLGRTGGVYIPPFKLARMMKEVEDKSSTEYQRLTWDALRKSINGLVNKVNATNIKNIIPELFGENLIRGRGLFCRSCMKSQLASPGFTDVFAALVAVVNTKFPEIGDLLLRRLVLQLKRAYKRNDKPQLLGVVKFVAHLVNQQVAHELIALELLTILLGQPTDDSVEVAVGFVTECGSMLQDLSPKGLHGIFERFRGILHEGEIDKRVQFLIEGLFAIRKAKFQGYPAIRPELDLVEPEDQLTHEISLMDDEIEPETALDIFKPDPNFVESEKKYEELKKSILGEESEDEEDGSDAAGSGSDEDDDEEDEEDEEERMEIQDQTETNLVNLRRTIYLTIMSSVDFEEAGHKLLKIKLEPGQEMELCIMLLECCSQERTYLRYYGLLGQRFCMINKVHQENFETCFVQQYSMIHRLETNKLRNVAKFFAHLLGTDALPWNVLSYIRLTEEDTTSSSRIFIKILFQELSEHLGIRLLNERLNDPTMIDSFESIFPKDNPKNTRFSINFFTSIGLGGITENLREYLKNMPRLIMQQQKQVSESEDGSGPDDSGSSDSDSPSSSSSSSSDESESESESDRRSRKRGRR